MTTKLETEEYRQRMKGLTAGIESWKLRHANAWLNPKDAETPIVTMIKGWLAYADHHQAAYESTIGDDYVLGDEWATIGFALRGLLNGDLGRLDGGSLDSLLCNNLTTEGWNCDTQERVNG